MQDRVALSLEEGDEADVPGWEPTNHTGIDLLRTFPVQHLSVPAVGRDSRAVAKICWEALQVFRNDASDRGQSIECWMAFPFLPVPFRLWRALMPVFLAIA
jgi:hypothetical protein